MDGKPPPPQEEAVEKQGASAIPGWLARLGLLPKVALALLFGATIALLSLPESTLPKGDSKKPLTVLYLGEPLVVDDKAFDVAMRRTRSFLAKSLALEHSVSDQELVPLSLLGADLDATRLRRILLDLRDPSSAMYQAASSHQLSAPSEGASMKILAPIAVDVEAALPALLRLKDEWDLTPHDARLDLEKKAVIPHQTGRLLDLDRTLSNIDQVLAEGSLKAKAHFLEKLPRRTEKDLEKVRFDTVLGHFETKYSRAEKAQDRTYNLRLAASRLDGTVLLPGETFDFNEVVGPRDEANGYRVATVISDGELVDGIGGGTCQISGTLHGAVFFAGLELVERYPHTRPSSYIKMGMDATVVYPTINFRFRNNFDFPVVIHEVVKGGTVRAEILGAPVDQVVTLIRKIDDVIPYEELERPDPKLARGERILSQRGIPGFRLHRYRVVRRGSHTVRQRWRDVYPPTQQVIAVGAAPQVGARRNSDPTPEYLADELLVLTQKRPTPEDPGDFAENRVAGRFGEEGWTEKFGMRLWVDPKSRRKSDEKRREARGE